MDTRETLIVILDEVELYFHPNWQKNLMKIITEELVKILPDDYNIQFLVTSHSPFLISDLPRENIIFLKNENGKCLQQEPEAMQKTFGANIHTLLSDSFFMSDGLMGEFAKEKINELIHEINSVVNNQKKFSKDYRDRLKKRIEIIGESFIREKLWEMVEKNSEESALELRIRRKKEELEELQYLAKTQNGK